MRSDDEDEEGDKSMRDEENADEESFYKVMVQALQQCGFEEDWDTNTMNQEYWNL